MFPKFIRLYFLTHFAIYFLPLPQPFHRHVPRRLSHGLSHNAPFELLWRESGRRCPVGTTAKDVFSFGFIRFSIYVSCYVWMFFWCLFPVLSGFPLFFFGVLFVILVFVCWGWLVSATFNPSSLLLRSTLPTSKVLSLFHLKIRPGKKRTLPVFLWLFLPLDSSNFFSSFFNQKTTT